MILFIQLFVSQVDTLGKELLKQYIRNSGRLLNTKPMSSSVMFSIIMHLSVRNSGGCILWFALAPGKRAFGKTFPKVFL